MAKHLRNSLFLLFTLLIISACAASEEANSALDNTTPWAFKTAEERGWPCGQGNCGGIINGISCGGCE